MARQLLQNRGRCGFLGAASASCVARPRCLSSRPVPRADPLHIKKNGIAAFFPYKRIQQRGDSHIARFQPDVTTEVAEGLRLPLKCQQLLGLKPGETYQISSITKAYDDLIETPTEPGYSQATVEGRAELLDIARSEIIAGKSQGPDRPYVTIPYDLVPGALAVLAEVGQNNLVLDLGKELLQSQELDGYQYLRNDVLLSMALSYCNLAREAFEARSQVSLGCRHLEDALQLLQSAGEPALAPALAKEIREGIKSLRSACALEEVAGAPTPENREKRKHAVRVIRELLKEAESTHVMAAARSATGRTADAAAAASAQVINQEFVQRLMRQLTCEEIVHLQEWNVIAKNPAPYKWLYDGLLQTVAVGHMVTGFRQCQPAYIKMALNILKSLPVNSEVLVQQAICQLLLGSVQASTHLLKEAESVQSSRYGASLLSTSATISGDNPVWSTGAHKFVSSNSPSQDDDGLLPGLCLFTEMWLRKVAFPLFIDTATSAPRMSLVKYFDDTRVETLITVYDEKSDVLVESLRSAFSSIKRTLSKTVAVGKEATMSVNVPDFTAMAASATGGDRQKAKILLMAVGAAVVGISAVALMTASGRRALHSTAPGISTSLYKWSDQQSTMGATAVAAEVLDDAVAEQVIKTWQDAKQAALGPNYDTSRLNTVLADPVLTETKQKVTSFKEQGWFMRYKLWKCKVLEVDSSMLRTTGGGFVTVTASLDESASLYGLDGRHADGYRSTYDAKYQISRHKDRTWRISKITVVGQEPHQGRA
eukprot:CAMPEP_0202892288 /NCGR_PEP_ID=MMETSP1392-20130828/2032_1 /ASSEMBLY_ACC=CAM_ASM_000868 /TAXON_ID=225041 /ORGANISM="Chlamydomonas chlamydogama, Strain SAG 11-48b" /LENGTH=766 /DNA_ID=CAMNT_0049576185 /DNA_START=50 /DNA_END=2350 /DNA_ORIENTATION=+